MIPETNARLVALGGALGWPMAVATVIIHVLIHFEASA
jgi:hypothetical protein